MAVFDIQDIIEEEKKKNKSVEETVVERQISYDEKKEEAEKALRKKSNIQEALSLTEKAINASKYIEKHGYGEFIEAAKANDPNFDERDILGIFNNQGSKAKTLDDEYGDDKPIIDATKKSFTMAGTTGAITNTYEQAKLNSSSPFESEVSVSESVGHAIAGNVIKIPYGFVNLTAMLIDMAAEDNLKVNQGAVARLENWFDQTYFGAAMDYSTAKAKETAVGRLTDVILQLYGSYKLAGKFGINVSKKASVMANKAIDAVRGGKYVRTARNKGAYELAKKTKQLNTLTKTQKYAGYLIGGGLVGGATYDVENIGTFGDIFFDEGELSAMDREKKSTAKEDAWRMFYNKLKLGGELGFPIVPTVVAGGKVAKLIATQGKNIAYSNKAVERFIDRFIARPFRSRGPYEQEVFESMQRLEGKQASARLIAEDSLRRFDQIIKKIANRTQKASDASGLTEGISNVIVKLINQGKMGVKNNKLIVKGFDRTTLDSIFKTFVNDLKISKNEAVSLIDELLDIHKYWAEFGNTILQGKNVNVGVKEFARILNDRIRNVLTTEYKIFKDNGLAPINEYSVSRGIKDEVADIFIRNAKENGVVMSKSSARLTVDSIIKTVKLDPMSGKPFFPYEPKGWDRESGVIVKRIAENITGGGKFKADKKGGLIRTKSDLEAFKKLFGEYQNATNIIANVTTDLAEIAARDTMYNRIKSVSKAYADAGERALVYDTYDAAVKAFRAAGPSTKLTPRPKIIEARQGLKLPQKLDAEVYTVPLNGMYTTEVIAQGLTYGAASNLGSITKNIFYQYAVTLPKGLIQAAKTVLGPFTHTRNFASGAVTTVATGNILIPPAEMGAAIRTAWRTIQPQIVSKNVRGKTQSVGAKEFTKEGGQSLYRFLLDQGMVNQSATYGDVMGLIQDAGKTGVFEFFSKKLPRTIKSFLKKAQQLYVAEDDFWKVFNFFGESYKIRRAYAAAVKAGKIKLKDVPGGSLDSIDILLAATRNVRAMLPNYAYVSEAVKASRRAPLGNFVSWPSEIIRTSTNIMTKAHKEINNPIFERMGWERMFGFLGATAVLAPTAVWSFQQLYGFSKERLYALREFIPFFSKSSTILPIYIDGKYKYIDFSRGYFYDTVTNPIQAIIVGMEQNKDKPVLPALVDGLGKAAYRLVEPFVSESIWIQGIQDIFSRGGETQQGTKVFYERDEPGTKLSKTIQYLAKLYSFGSSVQFKRMLASLTDTTIKGEKYEFGDELLGFIGARPIPVDIERSMRFFINDFIDSQSSERRILYYETRLGDPVDPNQLISQYFTANKQGYETFNTLRRQIDAALFLGVSEDKIRNLFKARGRKKLFNQIMDNQFVPFDISQGTKKQFRQISEEKGIPNVLEETYDTLMSMKEAFKNLPLNQKIRIKKEDYLRGKKDKRKNLPSWYKGDQSQAPLPQTPAPKISQVAPQINQQTGLTRTQSALLSPSEQVIARKT